MGQPIDPLRGTGHQPPMTSRPASLGWNKTLAIPEQEEHISILARSSLLAKILPEEGSDHLSALGFESEVNQLTWTLIYLILEVYFTLSSVYSAFPKIHIKNS